METKAHQTSSFRSSLRQRVRGSWLLVAAFSGLFAAPTVASATEPECDFWAQDCPNVDEKCMLHWEDEWVLKCTPTEADPSLPGEPCIPADEYGPDSCGPNAMCDAVNPSTGEGECLDFCTQSDSGVATCADWDYACGNFGPYGFCFPQCDPLMQDCEWNETCIPNWIDGDNAGTYVCVPVGADGEDEGYYGDPCEYVNDCQVGLICVADYVAPECEGGGCCTPLCDLDELDPCFDEGLECVPLYNNPNPGEEHVGYCRMLP